MQKLNKQLKVLFFSISPFAFSQVHASGIKYSLQALSVAKMFLLFETKKIDSYAN